MEEKYIDAYIIITYARLNVHYRGVIMVGLIESIKKIKKVNNYSIYQLMKQEIHEMKDEALYHYGLNFQRALVLTKMN